MARAKRICPKPGCPKVAGTRYCPEHEREYEAKRGNANQRGYGSQHQRARRLEAGRVATGQAVCSLCGNPIQPEQAWDLGHTDDRTSYSGAQHAGCNRADGGRRGRATQTGHLYHSNG